MKKCKRCGEIKKDEEFYLGRGMKDGRLNLCRKCYCSQTSNNRRNRFIKTKENYGIGRRTIETFGLKLSLYVYDRAKRKCESCGDVNDLTIHHKDNNGRNKENAGLPTNNNPSNLIVLCRKCHGRLHGLQYWKSRKEK
jgi:hypothetical protein